MYSALCIAVNAAALALGAPPLTPGAAAQEWPPAMTCDGALTALFTPIRPQLGRYEVCTTPEPLTALAAPSWPIETVGPLDAFGAAGSFDRAAVARLYGGRRATVARGFVRQGSRFEAITLISPHPDRQLMKLEPGTLVIRYFVSE